METECSTSVNYVVYNWFYGFIFSCAVHNHNLTKQEIWDRVQWQTARCCKSNWGENLGSWNSAPGNVTWPECNRISLRGTHSGHLGWVEMVQLNFAVSGPK